MTRPYDIAVSAKTFWLLQRIAAARRNLGKPLPSAFIESPWTADKVAEEILSDHMKRAFPELISIFDAREKANADAEGIITKTLWGPADVSDPYK